MFDLNNAIDSILVWDFPITLGGKTFPTRPPTLGDMAFMARMGAENPKERPPLVDVIPELRTDPDCLAKCLADSEAEPDCLADCLGKSSAEVAEVTSSHERASKLVVAPPGVEPGRPFGPKILNLLRMPFRQGAASHVPCC